MPSLRELNSKINKLKIKNEKGNPCLGSRFLTSEQFYERALLIVDAIGNKEYTMSKSDYEWFAKFKTLFDVTDDFTKDIQINYYGEDGTYVEVFDDITGSLVKEIEYCEAIKDILYNFYGHHVNKSFPEPWQTDKRVYTRPIEEGGKVTI